MACIGAAGILLSVQTFAASHTEQQLPREELVVTGSRIARADLTAVSPIVVVDSSTLEKLNITNAEEFLRQLPQFAAGIGGNSNNGNDGSSTIDLRNLGEERTLVLVNGKRFVPFDYQGYVDVAMIPARLIERVEIITGGASAVYGADAIAGVVNFIMKNEFEGMAFDASYGITEEGDADRYDMNATVGGAFDNGRGHIVFNVGYIKQDSVAQNERPYGVTALDDLLNEVGSFTTPEGTSNYETGGWDDPALDGLVQFDANGEIVPFSNTFNFNPFNLYVAPQQKWNSTTLVKYEITEKIEFFSRFSFANNKVNTIVAPTGTFFEQIPLNYASNPFLGQTAVDLFTLVDANEADPATNSDGLVQPFLGRRLVELGTRNSNYENTTYQVVGGLTGDFLETQNWEVFGQWGRTNRSQTFDNDTSLSAAQQASVAIDDGNGNAICAVPDAGNPGGFVASPDTGCAAANFYGGQLSQEAADFLRLNVNEINKTSQMIFGGSLSGDVPLTIPFADRPLAYAAGIEYREEKATNEPDANYARGNAIGFGASTPVNAEIEISEIFFEGQVPLVDGVPFVQSLMFDFGIRYGEYKNKTAATSNKFNNTSWKVGGEWSPIQSLRFRTSYQEAVRAPTIQEIGLPLTPSTGDLSNDPCEGANPVGNAALTQLCIDTGVPPSQVGSVVSIIAGQINNFLGGNPTLTPEEAQTLTLGFVWAPDFFESFSLTLDYYSIEIDNVIVEISEQNTVNACYNVEQNAALPFCQRVIRNSLGGLSGPKSAGVNIRRVNAAFRKQSGVDFGFDMGFGLGGAGALNLGFSSTYVIEDKRQDADFLPEFDCAGLVGGTCLRPGPQIRFFQTTAWSMGAFGVQLNWSFIDEIQQDAIKLSGADPADYALPTIDAQNKFDLLTSWAINDNWTLRLGINNLLDNSPPIPGNDYGGTTENSGNTFPATYDVLGRNYFFAVNAKF
jgi:iron complex outermembrane receptor protein